MAPKSLHSKNVITLPDQDDRQGFEILYSFYKPKLFIIAHSYITSREDAEEIVHDVLIRIWEKQDRIQLRSNLTAYLYSMTRNACLDYLRARKNKLSKELTVHQQEYRLHYNAFSDEVASAIILQELQDLVNKSIAQLPEKCRNVFLKSRMEGLNHKEISEELMIAPKTVENHISRALRHLRSALSEYLQIF